MTFILSGSEIRIYRASSGNKLRGVYDNSISFDGDAKNILLSILMYL